MVGAATQAELAPSAVRPTRLTAPVGCAWDSRSPVELPRYSVSRSSSANPASTASRARARSKAPDEGGQDASSTPESVSSGSSPKRAPPAPRAGSTRGNASSAGGAALASVSAAATISATPSVPTTPVRRAVPTRLAGEGDDADRAPALHAVGRRRVQREAHVGVAALLDQHDAAVGPGGVRRRARPCSTSSWAGITLSAPTPRAR